MKNQNLLFLVSHWLHAAERLYVDVDKKNKGKWTLSLSFLPVVSVDVSLQDFSAMA